jgi:hypothetical protein
MALTDDEFTMFDQAAPAGLTLARHAHFRGGGLTTYSWEMEAWGAEPWLSALGRALGNEQNEQDESGDGPIGEGSWLASAESRNALAVGRSRGRRRARRSALDGTSAAHIVANTRPEAVIILHEGGNRGRRAVQVLRRVLPVLSARGYRVVTLSELDSLGRSAGMPAASLETGRVSVANGHRCAGIPEPFSLG